MATVTPEQLARTFHEAYERLAPSFGYETRHETRVFDPTSANGRLMTAVAGEVLERLASPPAEDEPPMELDNHHNALRCPHCNPRGLVLCEPAQAPPASGRIDLAIRELEYCVAGNGGKVSCQDRAARALIHLRQAKEEK